MQIASRGFELLKPGGRMVYSTCSMNPAENESVVAALIQKYKGQLSIADVSQTLPGLVRRPGLTSWRIQARDGSWYSTWDDISDNDNWRYPKTLFPPPLQVMKDIHIERCVRVMPHDQDTGGFFVAVLDKAPLSAPLMNEDALDVTMTEDPVLPIQTEPMEEGGPLPTAGSLGGSEDVVMNDSSADVKPQHPNKRPKAPEALVPLGDSNLKLCHTARVFYGISEEFSFENLLSRSEETKPQKILFFSKGLREVITHNPRLKVVFSGIRMFQAVPDEETEYRVVQTGIDTIAPYMSKRLIPIDVTDLMMLLTYEDPLFTTFTKGGQQILQATEPGACVFVVTFGGEPMYFVGWRGKMSCKVLIKKTERNLLVEYLNTNGISLPSANETTTVAL